MRDSFVFYRSFYEALLGMSSDNQGDCLMAIANYAINGVEPEGMTPEVRMFFTLVKPQIDKNNQKYENGKNGGRPSNQSETKQKPKNNQTETKPKANVNVNVNENVKEKNTLKGIKKEKNFTIPMLEEVQAYCKERNNTVDPIKFVDYYTANGWKVGKNPMKDWRAAVRTWERGSVAAPASRKTADEDFYAQLNALGA